MTRHPRTVVLQLSVPAEKAAVMIACLEAQENPDGRSTDHFARLHNIPTTDLAVYVWSDDVGELPRIELKAKRKW